MEIKLFRGSWNPTNYTETLLEVDKVPHGLLGFFDYLKMKFGGVPEALNYVKSKYGNGSYQLKAYDHHGNLIGMQNFDFPSDADNNTCKCPIQQLMAKGCQCGKAKL